MRLPLLDLEHLYFFVASALLAVGFDAKFRSRLLRLTLYQAESRPSQRRVRMSHNMHRWQHRILPGILDHSRALPQGQIAECGHDLSTKNATSGLKDYQSRGV
jgi:hypothetical protein